ncbi:MAG TPA: peptidase P60 [Aurantimonas coralicida]|uniref:Peptidase P60 n=2 Tax=root TaxID=1 RepID=A0A9C9NFT7_9HYPH|nr:peptidase P60 [Aurantimonas coralicida]HEU01072.1 peptidase P60 [Aurantimonas coralicida]
MTSPLDSRLNAFRDDLADDRLQGRVEAAHFVRGEECHIVSPVAPVRRRPSPDAPLDTEALFGEPVTVFEIDAEGWSWVQLGTDGYVGYVPSVAIGRLGAAPTHRVSVPRTLLFPGPDIKLPPLHDLPMGALVAVTGAAEDHNARYAMTQPHGAVVEQHLKPLGTVEPDLVAVAERFVGVPYLWGGKSASGIDCSGLVQIACAMAGIAAPRDTDMQERGLGTRIAGIESLQRGDLVFWKGHVGIILDGTRLLHANAHHMLTAIEPLAKAIARLEAKGAAVTSIKRMDTSPAA